MFINVRVRIVFKFFKFIDFVFVFLLSCYYCDFLVNDSKYCVDKRELILIYIFDLEFLFILFLFGEVIK